MPIGGIQSGFDAASAVLRRLAEAQEPWAIPWPCIHEYLAIVTHPRVYDPPTPMARALEQVDIWLESPSLRLIAELSGHWKELATIARAAKIRGGPFTMPALWRFAASTVSASYGRRAEILSVLAVCVSRTRSSNEKALVAVASSCS